MCPYDLKGWKVTLLLKYHVHYLPLQIHVFDVLPGMLTGMTGMFVMTRYMQTSIWGIGNVFKWACLKLAIYFHLARLEMDSYLFSPPKYLSY